MATSQSAREAATDVSYGVDHPMVYANIIVACICFVLIILTIVNRKMIKEAFGTCDNKPDQADHFDLLESPVNDDEATIGMAEEVLDESPEPAVLDEATTEEETDEAGYTDPDVGETTDDGAEAGDEMVLEDVEGNEVEFSSPRADFRGSVHSKRSAQKSIGSSGLQEYEMNETPRSPRRNLKESRRPSNLRNEGISGRRSAKY